MGFLGQCSWAETIDALAARQAVKERQAAFVLIQRSFKDMADMAKGKREFDSDRLTLQMQRLALTSEILPELFPQGSESSGTNAATSVWDKNDEFMNRLGRYIALTRSFAKTSDYSEPELRQVVGKIGKECKSCHDEFKTK
jgi:cytochrome c556